MQNNIPANKDQLSITHSEPRVWQMGESTAKWELMGSGKYSIVGDTTPALPKGKYSLRWQDGRLCFNFREIHSDQLIRFPNSVFDQTLAEIRRFWEIKKEYVKNGYLHRRGYLLHGPQGTGKSCLIQQVVAHMLDMDGIILDCDATPEVVGLALQYLRIVEPNRPLLCLFEDIDALIDKHGEGAYLQMLDGENLIDNVLNIGTTNHIEKLNPRIRQRQRRFDRIVEVGYPDKDIRKKYLVKKLKMDEGKAEVLAARTEKCTFAALADLVISIKCFGVSVEDALKEIDGIKKNKSSSDFNDSFGFGRSGG